ncbi:MAG TPA: 50S ribosomal protein L11 methyltransferase [Saprospiraceae bacterium]|nr:50S ribosomal protein L11 methyltransferase [Saprospiraceae bacterium]HNN68483.1 50S ribosomal protein L11 methyltransferase [Saprospiraceae bacterium]
MQTYLELKLQLDPDDQEGWMGWLYDQGFENFVEEEQSLSGFLSCDQWTTDLQQEVEKRCLENKISSQIVIHDPRDWNAVWESNFEPIAIGQDLYVRATFHSPRSEFPTEIVIAPRMAFGTGHHATTAMILYWLTKQNLEGSSVLDFGCGTGILGIYAAKKKCACLDMIDNEEPAVENATEHCTMNQITADHILLGSVEVIPQKKYDLILANITRNVLEVCLPGLVRHLQTGGYLVISGFLNSDRDAMQHTLQSLGMEVTEVIQEQDWLAMVTQLKGHHRNA